MPAHRTRPGHLSTALRAEHSLQCRTDPGQQITITAHIGSARADVVTRRSRHCRCGQRAALNWLHESYRYSFLTVITAVIIGIGKTVLQTGMPELIYRPDGAQNVSLACVIEEFHEAHRRMPAHGKLCGGEC